MQPIQQLKTSMYISMVDLLYQVKGQKSNSLLPLPMWAWVVEQEGSPWTGCPLSMSILEGVLHQINTPQLSSKRTLLMKDRFLYYLDGYGQQGSFYKMAVQYDNNNPYTHL